MYDETQTVLDCSSTTVKYSNFSERLRPRTIEELLISDSSIAKFNAMIHSRDVMNMIFYGSHGTGKTTCANLIGKSPGIEMLYVNASLTNRIEDIRNQVERYATSMSLYGDTKIVLLDESDYLSKSAQASLRGLIEKTISNCRFILTSNVLSNIQQPLQSRCRPFCFDVPFLSLNESIEKLTQTIEHRLTEINVSIDEERLRQIVVMKFPDYRAIANDIEFELL
jgi:replication-associated recombination protein RarA